MRSICFIVAVVLVASCGGSTPSPTGASPTVAQLAGMWIIAETLTQVLEGECVGDALRQAVGQTNSGPVEIVQNGIGISVRFADAGSGATCTLTGSAGPSEFRLSGACDSVQAVATCASGQTRTLRQVANTINGQLDGGVMTGTSSETWSVTTPAGGSSWLMTLNSTFRGTRR